MSNLVSYAEKELELAGWSKDGGDYDGMLYKSVIELVETFSKQGHSGYSAAITTDVLNKLLKYEPLTPLTYEDENWIKHDDKTWQHNRKFTVFSTDQGKTWYDIYEEGMPKHPCKGG